MTGLTSRLLIESQLIVGGLVIVGLRVGDLDGLFLTPDAQPRPNNGIEMPLYKVAMGTSSSGDDDPVAIDWQLRIR